MGHTAISHIASHIDLCDNRPMPTNLDIDDRLIEQAQKLGHHRTKKETVNAALAEYIRRRKQRNVISLFGTIEYDAAYDHKRERRSKRS
ncbi:MAG TPA: type II toxin-antitoxin system VapB family antitoxin [Candidatus Acidoferrales bacterium]|nr:type II toxin-antitoxin system VapB family antitoxin [Candidatus Acidoferrales bacterium]